MQRYASQKSFGLLTFCTINLKKDRFGTFKLQSTDSHYFITYKMYRDQKIYEVQRN